MELDELKNVWTEYDKKLTESLRINEELLKRVNLDKSKNELQKLMYAEIASIIVAGIIFISMLFYSLYMIYQPKFCIMSMLCVMISLAYIILSIKTIKTFTKIDYYNTSIVQLQYQIESLRMLVLKFRKVDLILFIPYILLLFIVLFKWVHNIDLLRFEYVLDPVIRLVIIFGIAIPFTLWFNKHFYDKKIENAKYHLHEIERFTQEEEIFTSNII